MKPPEREPSTPDTASARPLREPHVQALLEALARLGGTTRSMAQLARDSRLPVPEVALALRGPDGCSGMEALGLVVLRRTRSGGLEISLTGSGIGLLQGRVPWMQAGGDGPR